MGKRNPTDKARTNSGGRRIIIKNPGLDNLLSTIRHCKDVTNIKILKGWLLAFVYFDQLLDDACTQKLVKITLLRELLSAQVCNIVIIIMEWMIPLWIPFETNIHCYLSIEYLRNW